MTLPPGFRFHPTDEELVSYYLTKRVKNTPIEFDVIADVDLYKCEPWDLPSKSKLPHGDNEWFFFSPRDRKYPNGSRTNRATEAGYWKATGRDRTIRKDTKTIGMKKTLVFYGGRAPHGARTDWLMHEYRLDGVDWESMNVPQDAYVLCRVFKKNGFGPPKNPSAGSGSMEEGDQVDSPGEVKSSTFADSDVKPSMTSLANLPPLSRPVSRPDVVSMEDHGPTGGDNCETRPPTVFSDDPFVHNGSFKLHFGDQDADVFFVDEGLDKMYDQTYLGSDSDYRLINFCINDGQGLELRNEEESLEDFYKICPPLEGSNLHFPDDDVYNDIPRLTDPSKVVRNEFQTKWLEQVSGAYHAFGGQTFPKQEDFVSPLPHENGFELPTLIQLPSPPTASPSFEENDTESSCLSSSNNNFTTIRLRTRPSSVSSPAVGNAYASSPYTAMRRVLYQQRGLNFASLPPPPVCESSPIAEKQLLDVPHTEGVEFESKKSLYSQAAASEKTNADNGDSNSEESSRAESVICSKISDVASDEGTVGDRSSPAPSPAVTLVPRKRVVDAPILSKPISEDLSLAQRVSSDASPSVVEMISPKVTMDEVSTKEVLDKEVCFQEYSGTSSVSHGTAEDVHQLTDPNKLIPAEASFDNVPESSNPTNDFLASDSRSMRIMGLRLLEPICGLRDFSAGHTASSKKKSTSRDMPSGIGSIHVNAVTVTCSCSSAGLPHVPTKACACYTTFWEGRCEKEKPTGEDSSEVQASETGQNPVPCISGRCVVLGILIPVLAAQFLLFPALSEYLSAERSSFSDSFLSFRDFLFGALGAVLFYLVQGRPMPWRWIRRRRSVNSRLSASDTM